MNNTWVLMPPHQILRRMIPLTSLPIRRHSALRAIQGLVLSVGAPLGWFGIQAWLYGNPWQHLHDNPILYIYMLVGTAVVFASFGFYVGLQEGRSAWAALRDPLTGLYNVRYYQARLADEVAQYPRRNKPVAVIVLDLDHFKQVNDRFGHPTGDRLLIAVAGVLGSVVRKGEAAARVGGEEFALILPESDAEVGRQVAERIRARLSQIGVELENGETLRVTASLGVASMPQVESHDWRKLYAKADQAMYAAKQAGRDRVVVASASGF